MTNKALVAAFLLSSAGLMQAAAIVSYDYPALASSGSGANFGNQSFGQALGMDFNINQAISILSLGAFDSGQDGFQSTITVRLYDRTTQLPVTGLITLSSSDTLIHGGRFQTLLSPITLQAGFQGTIVAYGYSAAEFNGNIGQGGTFNPATLNTGGYPTTSFAAGVGNQFGAGSFTFNLAGTATPEPVTLGTMAFGLLALGAARFRRRV